MVSLNGATLNKESIKLIIIIIIIKEGNDI